MHTASDRWRLGALLALTTAIMWGVLPIALKYTLIQMDAVTITWYRFVVASVILGAILAQRGRLPRLRSLNRRGWLLLAIATLGLCGNYLFYLLGLDYISPGTAQIVVQLAPILLLVGALAIFKERFSFWQWVGLGIFLVGQALFFNRQLLTVFNGASGESTGVWLVVISAVVWAAYALAQKQLLGVLGSDGILFCIYVAAVVLFFPASHPAQIGSIDLFTLGMLIFASLNTIVAYGAFAEALAHLDASRVSAIIAIAPLLTLAAMALLSMTIPTFSLEEPLDTLKIIGAITVVTGSILTATARHRR